MSFPKIVHQNGSFGQIRKNSLFCFRQPILNIFGFTLLNNMVNDDLIDMDDDLVKFSVSTFTTQVAAVGIKQAFDSLNQHPIPGELYSPFSVCKSVLMQVTCDANNTKVPFKYAELIY